MPKGYIIVTEAIHNEAGMMAYAEAATPSFRAYGGAVLVMDAWRCSRVNGPGPAQSSQNSSPLVRPVSGTRRPTTELLGRFGRRRQTAMW